jgi:phenol hydroxylase P0 protein
MPLNVIPSIGETPGFHRSAHITATLAERFVEFEFVLGDPDLAVELVLEGSQFAEFCRVQGVSHIDAAPEARSGWERLQRHLGLLIPTTEPGTPAVS